jgi:hypothetical protein
LQAFEQVTVKQFDLRRADLTAESARSTFIDKSDDAHVNSLGLENAVYLSKAEL